MNPMTLNEREYRERQLYAFRQQEELSAALRRLEENEDYRKVFLDGLFLRGAAHAVRNFDSDAFSEESRNRSMKLMSAICTLQNWIDETHMLGSNATANIDALLNGDEE